MERAWSTILHSTFPQGMNYYTSQTEAKNSFKSRAEGCWSCCLYFPGQRSNYVGFKGLFFYLPSWHASAGRILHSAPTFYKWKPRRANNVPKVTDSNLPRYFLTLILFLQISPNRPRDNFHGVFVGVFCFFVLFLLLETPSTLCLALLSIVKEVLHIPIPLLLKQLCFHTSLSNGIFFALRKLHFKVSG